MKSRKMKHLLVVIIVCVLALIGRGEESPLAKYREAYGKNLETIETNRKESEERLSGQYVQALDRLSADMQRAGRLDPLLMTKKEKERFQAFGTVDEVDLVSGFPELHKLQQNYRLAAFDLQVEKAKRVLSLAEEYQKYLSGKQAALTRSGDLEGALAIKKEREAVVDRAEVRAAKSLAASADRQRESMSNADPGTVAVEERPVAVVEEEPKRFTADDRKRAKKEISRRYKEFCEVLRKEKWDEAVDFLLPELVEQHGRRSATQVVKMTRPMIMIADRLGVVVNDDEVEVDDQGERGKLTPRVWVGDHWQSGNSIFWRQSDGKWYIYRGPNPRQ